jgi:peptide/nickel transport system substrate-binding protein
VPSGALPRAVFAGAKQVKQIDYDLPAARLLLDSLGWLDTNGDGVRRKNGVPLEFSVLVPSTSSTRARYAVLLQEQLRQVGAKLNIETLDITPFLQRLGARDFDAALGSWHVDPSPGSLRQTWGIAGARADGGSNAGAYENPVFDALVDSALTALDKSKSDRYWERAIQVIVDDAPAVFLYEPRLVAGASKRLRISGVRPDAWWAGLSDWWIPKSERNARDRIGLRDVEQ